MDHLPFPQSVSVEEFLAELLETFDLRSTSTPKIATAQSTIILGSSRVSCSMPHLLKGLPTCFGIPSPRPQLLIAPCLSCPQKEPIWLCRACFLSSQLIRKSNEWSWEFTDSQLMGHLLLPGNLCIYTGPNPEEGLRWQDFWSTIEQVCKAGCDPHHTGFSPNLLHSHQE